MKSTVLSIVSSIIILVTAGIIFNGCKKAPVDEVKVPDFATLSSQFAQPPSEYTTAPFFVWNAEISRDEIDKFMEGFKIAGSSQVFVHPRPGLVTEYLSDNWFDLYKYTVDKGKELGMNVWIYDENSYPSGFAGGHVPDEMPESFNQGQGLEMHSFEILPDSASKFYLCLKEENGKYTDITSSLDSEKGKSGKYLLFSKTFNEISDWYGGFSYVDLLVKGVTEKFIDRTMKGYTAKLGTEFGKTVPGTFTDEPQISSPGGIRWTPDLFDAFMKRWNYDLRTCLPSLFEETGDWKKVRHNYTQTLLELFIDRWSKPWYEWCEKNNMKFTGHYWEHEWPGMSNGGDNMAMYAWHHVPAIDMLFNQFNDSSSRAQFGNVRSVKELASAANQTGRQRKLSETYGGSGWDLNFADMKRNGDWEYALGVNFMNQHLTYFTLTGARKYDYPPTFDYHEPWWNNYRYINDHYARLSLALSSGKQVNDILVLEPTTSCWLYDSYTNPDTRTEETGRNFQAFITRLEKDQVEYDLGSEKIMEDLGSVSGGKLIVGHASYSKVVIPPMTENLNSSTLAILKKFVASGGKLIVFSEPSLIDGSSSSELKDFFGGSQENIIKGGSPDLAGKTENFASEGIRFENVNGGTLYHHRRILSDGELVFLVNSSSAEALTGSMTVKGADAIELNTLTGEKYGYQNSSNGDSVACNFSLPPAGSLLLFFPGESNETLPVPPARGNMTAVSPVAEPAVSLESDNVLMIDFCDLELAGETTRDLNNYEAADKVYKFWGFKNGNPWNTSVQFRTNIIDRDTFGINTGFTATYHFTVKGFTGMPGMKAALERPGLYTVTVNGVPVQPLEGKWWLDRSIALFDISSLVRTGDNTISLKASPMKVHAEIEPIYILGPFSVTAATKGFVIEPPVKTLKTGSWKSQGLPFYSWNVTYTEEFMIDKPEGTWEAGLGEWNGTIAELTVNGKKAGLLAFPPYRADITGLLKTGSNKVEIKVTGSLKNLLGPHHTEPSPGFVTPGSWRGVKAYPPGKDYSMIDYGLFEPFRLYHAL